MRNGLIAIPIFLCALLATTGAEAATGSVQGFGGLTFGTSSFVSQTSMAPSVGGGVTASLTPNIQAVGEFGRLSDIKPPLLDLLDFTPVNLRVSAWYGDGGVRFVASPRSVVRPYAEATAGMARLSTGLSGFG